MYVIYSFIYILEFKLGSFTSLKIMCCITKRSICCNTMSVYTHHTRPHPPPEGSRCDSHIVQEPEHKLLPLTTNNKTHPPGTWIKDTMSLLIWIIPLGYVLVFYLAGVHRWGGGWRDGSARGGRWGRSGWCVGQFGVVWIEVTVPRERNVI